MTVQTPGSGAPQAGGTTAPQAGGAGSPSDPPQDGNRQDLQRDTGQQPQDGQQAQGQQPDEGELPEPVREMLRNYRQENRSLRERLRAVEQGQQQGNGQPQGDTITREQFQRAEQQWQDRLRQQGVRSEVAMASAKLGIVDPEAAYRLLDTDDLDFDDKGQPTNVEAALKGLTRERPWLVNRAPRGGADGGAGGQAPRQGQSMNDVLRQATGRGPRGG